MALFTNLQSLSQTAGANPPDGSADAPSTIPVDLRLLGSFDAIMRDGAHQWANTVGGTTNAVTITVNGISALVAGQTFRWIATGANTGNVTLNVNGLGVKNVYKHGASALAAGDIASLSTVCVTWDGTNMQLTGVAQSSSLTGNGWAKFSNGLLVQWGSATSSAAGAASVSFATVFPNALLSVTLTATASAPGLATQETGSSSGFTFSVWNLAGARITNGATYIAIGY